MPGGADITYSVPEDKDLLYVEADVAVPGGRTSSTEVLPPTGNVIEIRGLCSYRSPAGDALQRQPRAAARSEGCPVTITPLTPPYMDVYNSLKMKADFGGINISFANEKQRLCWQSY